MEQCSIRPQYRSLRVSLSQGLGRKLLFIVRSILSILSIPLLLWIHSPSVPLTRMLLSVLDTVLIFQKLDWGLNWRVQTAFGRIYLRNRGKRSATTPNRSRRPLKRARTDSQPSSPPLNLSHLLNLPAVRHLSTNIEGLIGFSSAHHIEGFHPRANLSPCNCTCYCGIYFST